MNVTLLKENLAFILNTNRAKHIAAYAIAIEKYREQALEWFHEQVDALKAGRDPKRSLPLPLPEQHTDDFDRALRMLAMHQGDTIELSESQYSQFVDNEWGWARSFAQNTTSYMQE